MASYGTFVSGTFKPMSVAEYSGDAMAKHGQVYEMRIQKTQVMTPVQERALVYNLMNMKVPGCIVLAAEAVGDKVRLQVKANVFNWIALISTLIPVVGPILLFILGYVFITAIPWWVWAVIPIGIGAGIFVYAVIKARGR